MNITCNKCGETKNETAFDHDSSQKNGRRKICKSCRVSNKKKVYKQFENNCAWFDKR